MMESNDENENDDIDEIDNGDRSPDLAWQCLDRAAQVFAVPSCKLNDDNHLNHFDHFDHW